MAPADALQIASSRTCMGCPRGLHANHDINRRAVSPGSCGPFAAKPRISAGIPPAPEGAAMNVRRAAAGALLALAVMGARAASPFDGFWMRVNDDKSLDPGSQVEY